MFHDLMGEHTIMQEGTGLVLSQLNISDNEKLAGLK